ncbi:tyrosine-protein phosphatase [Pedobacter xixiisoli]|uniref:protein-tyrosine-phosphatase n=1 Tax=Pedobacter xixiisoli TaxID=1476464 RepID=A0A286AF84_9SPHI|nr:CpsB/CapC family capsule biosynthesis tyrosine phosphatase [Pedobacter xixiisoli]SOD20552.1 Tyrosine-protein phosphatase YwqE [Pedobacter xixiisoli]
MFGLFKKRGKEPNIDFSSVVTDMHSHIIPSIDDGAPNLEASLVMAKKYVDLGFKKVIATPHVMADFYRNTPDTINKGLDVLKEGLLKNEINLEVEAAAEYYFDETFINKLNRKEVLGFGNNYLLFELSYINQPPNLLDVLFKIQDAGFYPVLAHPERYPYYHGSIENYQQIIEYGCFLQLNTISLTGYYGKGVKNAAESLVDHHCISFLGSDMHHLRHAKALKESLNLSRVEKLIQQGHLNNVLL